MQGAFRFRQRYVNYLTPSRRSSQISFEFERWPSILSILHYSSGSMYRTRTKIPLFDSRGNNLYKYLSIICIQSNLSNIFTNIYQCFDFRTEIPTNYIFNNNIRVYSCTICHFHAQYLLYKVSYIYFTLSEFVSSSSIF